MNARLRRLGLLLAISSTLILIGSSTALAIPGDPPIANLTPPSGATIPVPADPIKATFSCPAYTKSEATEDDPAVAGDVDDYGMRFSTSPAVGPDGRLTTSGFDELSAEPLIDLAPDKVTCSGELELPTTPNPAALYQGTVYWQAFRGCESCDEEYEVGPVSSFALTPNVEEPQLELQDHIYAGYLTKVSFLSFSDLTGANIVLQRFEAGEWRELARQPVGLVGGADFFLKLAAGHAQLRAVVVGATASLPLEPQKIFVRKPGKRSVGKKDLGAYQVAKKSERKTAPLGFEVANGGKLLVHLKVRIPTTCSAGSVSVPYVATAGLRRARIAPDGNVIGEMTSKGTTPAHVTLVGNLHDQRFSGEVSTSFLNCTGTREIEATPVMANGGSKGRGRPQGEPSSGAH